MVGAGEGAWVQTEGAWEKPEKWGGTVGWIRRRSMRSGQRVLVGSGARGMRRSVYGSRGKGVVWKRVRSRHRSVGRNIRESFGWS